MRKKFLPILLFSHFALLSVISFAQAPAEFNFQGMARGKYGAPLMSQDIGLRFSIRTGSAGGTVVYQESRSVLTDSTGVFNAVIGGAGATNATGRLDTIIWKSGSKFLQVEMDEDNGTDYINLGATQLLSVPFAMFSNNASFSDSSRKADSSTYARSSGSYFFEAVYTDLYTDVSGSNTLKFPRTNYNHLNNITGKPVYDSTTGEFTAPETGVYQFDIVTDIYDGEDGGDEVYLMKNRVKIHKFLLDYYNGFHRRVYLKAGDRISIEYNGGTSNVEASNEDVENYFSGYKIY
jgi:hypothetical protein